MASQGPRDEPSRGPFCLTSQWHRLQPVGFRHCTRTKTHRLKPVPLKSTPPRNCATILGESISCARTQFDFVYALIHVLAIAYGYDFASVRRRMSAQKPGDPFDVVTYPHLLAIPQKGNKVDYELDAQSPMETESCVHSLFPHYGYTPCWYVLRRSKSPTQMTIVFPASRFK